jgi:AcrR family transcriptional regulator
MHWYSTFVSDVKSEVKRNRRAQKTEETRRRIVEAARTLFVEHGYAMTSIDAIARRANVAVETVYSRFKNKPGILDAVLGTAITGADDPHDLLDTPPYRAVAECADQRQQLRMLAHLSRVTLERAVTAHRILETVGSAEARTALQRQTGYRVEAQRLAIALLLANGPLKDGLTIEEAGATYSALANPQNFQMLTSTIGWSPDNFERWLGDCLIRLLLPSGAQTSD